MTSARPQQPAASFPPHLPVAVRGRSQRRKPFNGPVVPSVGSRSTDQSGEFPAAGVVPVSWSDDPRRISGNTKGRARRPAGGSACDTWRSDTASPSEPFSAGPASPFWARSWASTTSPPPLRLNRRIPKNRTCARLESPADRSLGTKPSPPIQTPFGRTPRDRTFTAHSTPVGRSPRDQTVHPPNRGSLPCLRVMSFSLPLWSRTAAEIERCFSFQVDRLVWAVRWLPARAPFLSGMLRRSIGSRSRGVLLFRSSAFLEQCVGFPLGHFSERDPELAWV
jgi:hypothetical protein